MFVEIALLALLVAFLRGGRLENLVSLPWKKVELVVFALLLRYSIPLLGFFDLPGLSFWAGLGYILSYVVLLWGLFLNFRLPWVKVLIFGVTLNFAVITANGGHMPVSHWASDAAGLTNYQELKGRPADLHIQEEDSSRLFLLADIVPVNIPPKNVISIGDIFIALGIFALINAGMVRRS